MTETSTISLQPPVETVLALREKSFFVPFYQRGYRWGPKQVELLLKDIEKNTQHGSKYSLQPIVVAPQPTDQKNTWELIDGQQRLTTLNLILLALGESTIPIEYARQHGDANEADVNEGLRPHLKQISSKTDWDALKNTDPHSDLDTVDHHHIVNAWLTIKTWLNNQKPDAFFMKEAILCRTSVIWHEVPPKGATSEFLRFNTAKIHLSPCELLKARFLANFSPPMLQRSPTEIAAEWDQMESSFHDEAFWNFLNPPARVSEAPNRNALLFELLHPTAKDVEAGQAYFENFPESSGVTEIETGWLEIRRCFLTLREWFADREMRHQIGFLRWSKTGGNNVSLNSLWDAFDQPGMSRSAFRIWIMEKVRSIIISDGKYDRWEGESYEPGKDNAYLQDLLLWFNIRALPPGTDYPFARHASVKTWSLEHIHAQSSLDKANEKQLEEWKSGSLKILKPIIEKTTGEKKDKLIELSKEIEKISTAEKAGSDEFNEILTQAKKLSDELENELPVPVGEDLNKVWNLALLGSDLNSSLSNGFFFQKRDKILAFEKDETRFIPHATVRVFLKAYSNEPDNLMIWGNADREAYKDRINKIIVEFTKKEGASHHV